MKTYGLIFCFILSPSAIFADDASRDALAAAAEANNHELKAMRLEIESKERMTPTAYAIPRTMLEYELMNKNISKGSGMGSPAMEEQKFSVTQEIPFPTAMLSSAKEKKAEVGIAEAQYRKGLASMRRDVTLMYNEIVFMRRQISIMEAKLSELRSLENFAEAKMRTGKLSADEFIKVRVMTAMAEKELVAMKAGRAQAENSLLAMIASDALPDSIEYSYTSDVAADMKAGRTAAASSPDVKLVRAQTEKLSRRESASLAAIAPDINLGFALSYPKNGDKNYSVSAGVSLPLFFGLNELPEARAAGKMRESSRELEAETVTRVSRELDSLFAAIAKNRATLSIISGRIIADTRQSLDLSLRGLQTDRADVMSVLGIVLSFYDYSIEAEKARFELASDSARVMYHLGR